MAKRRGYKIDAAFARTVQQLARHSRTAAPQTRRAPRMGGTPGVGWAGIVTAWTPLASTGEGAYRWLYTVQRARFDRDTQAMVATEDPPSAGVINLNEISNVPQLTGVQGNSVDQGTPDFPATFLLRPIGGGSGGIPANNVTVWVWPIPAQEDDGNGTKVVTTQLVFDLPNAIDGDCPEA